MADLFDPDYQGPVKPDQTGPEGSGSGAKTYETATDRFPSFGAMPAPSEPPPSEVHYASWYSEHAEPTWHQRGEECTGFALAGAVNYLIRSRVDPAAASVSPRMMYEMAQIFDRAAWEEGSTLRGALIGWQRRGVTTQDLWPYDPDDEDGHVHGGLTLARINDARTRQLSSDYATIDAGDIAKMQAALADRNVLYVSAKIHKGWFPPLLPGEGVVRPNEDCEHSPQPPYCDKPLNGYHAFLIVGYNEKGFWVHNSWGRYWGDDGYALLPYEEWRVHGGDVWVPEFDVPKPSLAATSGTSEENDQELAIAHKMWGHVVALDDNGRLSAEGLYATTSATLRSFFYLFEQQTKDWDRRRLLVFADDGHLPRAEAVERLSHLRDELMAQQVYPIFLVWDVPWHPDLNDEVTLDEPWGTAEEREQVDIGTADNPDIVDISYWLYEYQVAQTLAVAMWRAIQERARNASALPDGGARVLAERIRNKLEGRGVKGLDFDIHIAAHGAGAFTLPELAPLLPAPIISCELWAPAAPMADFEKVYAAMLDDGRLQRMTITVLDDASERNDHIGNYQESILCLASNVLAVDGIDSSERFYYGPRSEAPEDPSESMMSDEWRHKLHCEPEPLLGLHRFSAASDAITSRGDRIQINVVTDLTHYELATEPLVWDSTIRRLQQPPAAGDSQRPTDGPRPPEESGSPVHGDPLVLAEQRWRARQTSTASDRSPPVGAGPVGGSDREDADPSAEEGRQPGDASDAGTQDPLVRARQDFLER